ncbi:hypothetical protein E4J93_02265 [Collinsella sp. BA40]|uniref:O-antigen ligase family protein n=1 Tax=Collinsella sp. BA40 TaxID=2560852 RepID=UPI0011C7F33B|nr:hypothetical protein [Collinsella sp. BA40]TXF37839.1 hypothetical protein E4J93_02265 [Collinsella sp. BA40]
MAYSFGARNATVSTSTPVVIIAALIAFQGGYYPALCALAVIAFSLLALARAVVRRGKWKAFATTGAGASRNEKSGCTPPLLAISAAIAICMLAWCAARPLLDGIASYETLAAMARPALAIATATYWLQLSQAEKRSAIQLIAYESVLFSVVALLMFARVLPYPGAVVDGRLQFTFQYANTAGAYFAVMSCLVWSQARTRAAKALVTAPIICTALTQSMGTFTVIAIVGCAWVLKNLKLTRLKRDNATQTKASTSKIAIAVLGIGALAVFAICIGAPDRLDSALQTGMERLIQTIDGTRALASAPHIGIGPQQWRVVHPRVQSAQYTANVIHNSYLGFTLSYGLIGTTLAVLCMVTLWKGTLKATEDRIPGTHAAATLLLLHALVDFDLAFGSIIMLLVLALLSNRELASTACTASSTPDQRARARFLLPAALVIILLACGASALTFDVRENQILTDIQALGPHAASQQIAKDPLACRDQTVRTRLYQCCTRQDECEAVLKLQRRDPITVTTPGMTALARCLYTADRPEEAELVLLRALQDQPYNVAAYTQAADLFARYDVSEQTEQRYETLRTRSLDYLAAWPANLLNNQQEPPRIEAQQP